LAGSYFCTRILFYISGTEIDRLDPGVSLWCFIVEHMRYKGTSTSTLLCCLVVGTVDNPMATPYLQ